MGVITLDGMDEATASQLAKLAEAHGRSPAQEALDLVREGLRRHAERAALIERVREIAALSPKGVQQTDSVTLLREDRDCDH
jgi:hypothetical protein